MFSISKNARQKQVISHEIIMLSKHNMQAPFQIRKSLLPAKVIRNAAQVFMNHLVLDCSVQGKKFLAGQCRVPYYGQIRPQERCVSSPCAKAADKVCLSLFQGSVPFF